MSTVRSEVMISTPLSNYQEILKIAVNDGKAAAAEVCSPVLIIWLTMRQLKG